MIFFDFEVFKYDWCIVWSDTKTQKFYSIVNDVEKLNRFYYYYYISELMVTYNGNHYDKYILQGILCGFNPYDISDWIINKGKQGWEYSKLLSRFPIITYDTLVKDKGLKDLECSLGMAIHETTVPFNIDRKLTENEIEEVLEYCRFDVRATMEVFLQSGFHQSPQDEYQSSVDIIEEFGFPKHYLSKTKAQLGCSILGARKIKTNDEFDIKVPNLNLGKYEYVKEWFLNPKNHWYSKKIEGKKQPKKNEFITNIAGLETTYAWGGIHANCEAGIYDGILINCDFGSLYSNIMVNFDLVSRGVKNPKRYKELLETRLKLKRQGIAREKCYKIALNGSYGQMKYKSSPLYDPRNANNICVFGQIITTFLTKELECCGQILMINTDGVLMRVNSKSDIEKVKRICEYVSKIINISIDVDLYKRYITKDVNNYILIDENGKYKAKGSYVKKLNPFEMSLSIINKAIREYYVNGISARETINKCDDILEFQIIAKAGSKYDCAIKNTELNIISDRDKNGKKIKLKTYTGGYILNEKCNRVFASKNPKDGGIFKKHKNGQIAKIEMTPEKCFVINSDVRGMKLPKDLDKQWYINLAEKRIREFVNQRGR